jgi:uncharacterized protein (TIRG00374 family)
MKIKYLYTNFFDWKFILSLLISLLFSFYAFRNFELSKLSNIIGGINFSYIFLAIFFLIFSVYIRALRWQLLFKNNKPSINKLFGSQLIGYFGNNIFPLRAGELLRCVFLSRYYEITKSSIFGTVILERVLDVFGMIFLFTLLFFTDFKVNFDIYAKVVLILLFLIIILIFLYKNQFLYKGNNKILSIINDIINGFKGLSYKNILPITFYTILIWSFYVIMVYLVQYSITLNLSISECIFILFISSLMLSIPSAPANIGTFEAGVIYAMGIIGSSLYQLEFAIILHMITFFPYVIIGGLFFIYYNYKILDNE